MVSIRLGQCKKNLKRGANFITHRGLIGGKESVIDSIDGVGKGNSILLLPRRRSILRVVAKGISGKKEEEE